LAVAVAVALDLAFAWGTTIAITKSKGTVWCPRRYGLQSP